MTTCRRPGRAGGSAPGQRSTQPRRARTAGRSRHSHDIMVTHGIGGSGQGAESRGLGSSERCNSAVLPRHQQDRERAGSACGHAAMRAPGRRLACPLRTIVVMLNNQGSPRGETEVARAELVDGHGPSRGGPRHPDRQPDAQPRRRNRRQAQGYRESSRSARRSKATPLVDHQHPHDLLMQSAFLWRVPFASGAVHGRRRAGGRAGARPVAFMHRSWRPSPLSPLGHHTFDSTHITFGVVTAAVDAGPVVVEGVRLPWPGTGREPMGPDGSRAARLVVNPQAGTGRRTHKLSYTGS